MRYEPHSPFPAGVVPHRSSRAMVAASLFLAGTFRRGGNLDVARVWLADAKAWRTGRYGSSPILASLVEREAVALATDRRVAA